MSSIIQPNQTQKVYKDARDAIMGEVYDAALADPRIVVLTCDTGAFKFRDFKANIPEQFYNVGISEQNALSVAGGLAATGRHVFVFGITNFVTVRALEQVKLDVCCMERSVTILGLGTGLVYSIDGPTHHITEDVSVMRALPNMTIWSPSDYAMAAGCVRLALEHRKPSYIRFDKGPFTPVYAPGADFSAGVERLREGRDVTIVTTGVMLTEALKVVEALQERGVDAGLIDLYRLKPVNAERLVELVRNDRRLVTLEEHTIVGGLGSIVCEAVAEAGLGIPVKRLGIPDVYHFEVGSREYLRELDGIDVAGACAAVERFVGAACPA